VIVFFQREEAKANRSEGKDERAESPSMVESVAQESSWEIDIFIEW
jgi:hypothetical protein